MIRGEVSVKVVGPGDRVDRLWMRLGTGKCECAYLVSVKWWGIREGRGAVCVKGQGVCSLWGSVYRGNVCA